MDLVVLIEKTVTGLGFELVDIERRNLQARQVDIRRFFLMHEFDVGSGKTGNSGQAVFYAFVTT